ncbi:MAG: trypsin-like serine protease [Propionibacteriaceae bacterium]|nr:trypsin-like serine protease [Propionibacteriaceae bacterium]
MEVITVKVKSIISCSKMTLSMSLLAVVSLVSQGTQGMASLGLNGVTSSMSQVDYPVEFSPQDDSVLEESESLYSYRSKESKFSYFGGVPYVTVDGFGDPVEIDISKLDHNEGIAIDPYSGAGVGGGNISPQTIIGVDERYQILDTTKYPYGAIVNLESSITRCTGWMVSWDTIVTAAHCMYSPKLKEYASEWKIAPGRDGDSYPFGVYDSSNVTFTYINGNYILSEGKDISSDWGIIKLNNRIGEVTGWFGVLSAVDNDSGGASQLVSITGYPGGDSWGTMLSMMGYVAPTDSMGLCYSIDTIGGQSGAPVYLPSKQVIAIHTYGVGAHCDNTNSGTLISEFIYNLIVLVALSDAS